ncbi:MAG TPA: ferredoxin-thioredoxin reductase catalytic domain-containing protein [Candidatus Limnocylindrales bacterium]|nr:ferredoxin-thioredoxin reductase catalytic domain-containing protein [Candidatus Limnocylindrales bacterium]
MKSSIFCEVCKVAFLYRGPLETGKVIVCTVCGAELKINQVEPGITAGRYPQDPETEIRRRAENFAGLRGYVFNEDKELVLEGLIEKQRMFGDFYCPCRFENIAENICPCLETRMNKVRKAGQCY